MESIPREIKLMKQIAEHLKMWFQEEPEDRHYPSGTVNLSIRNNISLRLELEYLDEVLTWLRVNDHKEIARSLEHERDSFLSDLQAVEQAIERGDNPPLELIELRSKITGLIRTLEHTAKVFTEKLTPEKPAETEQKAALSIRQRIWIYLKRIPRWIYVLVIFFAALLTIFHYLGWLAPIRRFIYNTLSQIP